MSVLIKMEMPRSCADCPLTWVDDEYDKRCCITDKVVLGTIGRQDNANCTDCDCPLIEVPPHGRLIDADAFDERVRVAGGMSEEELTEDFKDGVQTVLYMLSKQPTIIEAEGSDT